MERIEQGLNVLVVWILCGVLIAAFGVQFILGEQPCPLCLLQRLGMIAVGLSLLMNVFFGLNVRHYGMALMSALFGGFVALRQISLHVCPEFNKFGVPVLGLSLYTWSFIVFECVVLAVAIMLLLHRPKKESRPLEGIFGWSAFVTLLLITVVNVVATLLQCGLGACVD
ncbi:MAG: disulfide bond formation protein B [Parachlamydiaceae bacterium]|nr:disulfide bond formation protein B [Parachlamydiaceae bacterium]